MLIKVKKAAVACALLGLFAFAGSASAALETRYTANCKPLSPETVEAGKEKRKLGLTDEYVYKQMQKAQDPLGREAYDEALAILLPLIERSENKPYESAWVRMQISFVYANKKAWPKAIEMAKAAIDKQALQEAQELQLRQNLVYFYLSAENNAKALEAAQEYFKYAVAPKPDMYALLGSIYFQLNRYQDSICPTFLAVTKAPTAKKPWLQLLASAHMELKDLEGTGIVLRDMLDKFPDDKNLWLQLSSIYLQQEKDADALAILDLAYMKGHVDQEGHLKNLAGLYANSGVPFKAAQILEKGIAAGHIPANEKNWRSIGQNFGAARDDAKAIAAYGEAAKFAADGTYFQYQGEIYSQNEKWPEAVAAFTKALEKGGLKDPGRVYLNLGIAQYSQGKVQPALANLEKATQYDKSRSNAASWIAFINSKRVASE
ncbi:tetratricopeptide repeat protein [Permianibacter sp. IMCC34836]|uniref:tetratricopeptide repeat protein n=1 Tax=Permianibacter fluminis TaxID=2738515 RepID=UPI001555B624|nr:tetratricopeptide repeat protein [Permianibacter fluminis]NQD38738.1 tetratricopeptide repeat protein [Permianibacter fluminis]